MARPRSFDEQSVLDAAAAQFRIHGFANTTTEQLCEAAGVQRSSLYNTFTSKDELFVQALERYTDVTTSIQTAVLTDSDLAGGARLQRLMELVIEEEDEASSEGHAAGCMTVHAYMTPNLRNADARIQEILDRDLDKRLSLLAQAVRAGQIDGTVRADPDPKDVAMLVVTLISGLRVTAQTGAPPEQLRRIATAGLRAVLT